MSKKYYQVEFNIVEGVWAEDENEAYATARRRLETVDNPRDMIFNYDDCVTEAPDCEDWEDPDAPELEEEQLNDNI